VRQVISGGGFGQLNAPPRFGKTVTMTYLTCHFQMKTLFLSHEISLSQQALKTFYRCTNVVDIENQLGREVIGLVHEWEDLEKYDVAFMPYQKFVSGTDAEEWLKRYKNRFGVVWIDESHIASRDWYSRIVGSFNSRIRLGVSGTTERKNNMHKVTNFVIGPVVVEGKSEQLPCDVTVIRTGIQIPFKKSVSNTKWWWAKVKSWLAGLPDRNKSIAKMIAEYVSNGHSCIAVTTSSVHCEELAQLLKIQYGISAEAYHAKRFQHGNKEKKAALREACLQRVRSGEVQVLIAVRSMVLGLDLPRLTGFFNLIPTSNGPDYYQEFSRIRTPHTFENGVAKTMGYIVDLVDDHFLLEGSYNSRKKCYSKEKFNVAEYKTPVW
jgi:superfamily II DNA or RNA helicase